MVCLRLLHPAQTALSVRCPASGSTLTATTATGGGAFGASARGSGQFLAMCLACGHLWQNLVSRRPRSATLGPSRSFRGMWAACPPTRSAIGLLGLNIEGMKGSSRDYTLHVYICSIQRLYLRIKEIRHIEMKSASINKRIDTFGNHSLEKKHNISPPTSLYIHFSLTWFSSTLFNMSLISFGSKFSSAHACCSISIFLFIFVVVDSENDDHICCIAFNFQCHSHRHC